MDENKKQTNGDARWCSRYRWHGSCLLQYISFCLSFRAFFVCAHNSDYCKNGEIRKSATKSTVRVHLSRRRNKCSRWFCRGYKKKVVLFCCFMSKLFFSHLTLWTWKSSSLFTIEKQNANNWNRNQMNAEVQSGMAVTVSMEVNRIWGINSNT